MAQVIDEYFEIFEDDDVMSSDMLYFLNFIGLGIGKLNDINDTNDILIIV